MILQRIRKSRSTKLLSLALGLTLIFGSFPMDVHALTEGPSTPEVNSFTPVGTSDMVDLFTGDFKYNIPLMDVGGYPINISYNAGITMEQEASWVGLGWNLNPGTINRNMRGIPDEFNGTDDKITKDFNKKPNTTWGLKLDFSNAEIFGFNLKKIGGAAGGKLSFGIGINHNSYSGYFISKSVNMGLSAGKTGKGKFTGNLGLSSDGDGISVTPSLSYQNNMDDKKATFKSSIGTSYNSLQGLKGYNFSASAINTSMSMGQSFGGKTYVPSIQMPMSNSAASFTVEFGATIFGYDQNVAVNGYFSEQALASKTRVVPAYGYLYSNLPNNNGGFIMDINRENDGGYTSDKPMLPLTNFTYDIFSVQAQGLSGQYHAKLGSYGTVTDENNKTNNNSVNEGFNIDAANIANAGFNIGGTFSSNTSGKWNSGVTNSYNFGSGTSADYEKYYFVESNELAIETDQPYVNAINGKDLVYPRLKFVGKQYRVDIDEDLSSGGSEISTPQTKREVRQVRNQLMNALTASETSLYGNATEDIQSYKEPFVFAQNISSTNVDELNRNSSNGRKSHHFSEIDILKTDGSKYVFGIPAYNILQRDISFTLAETTTASEGIATCNSNSNSDSNPNGDNYYSCTETPAYPYSFLLTQVLSPNYKDIDDIRGPSIGDLGGYTKFNYIRKYSDFSWRAPYFNNTVRFSDEIYSDPTDNKGSYTEGEKEIWYMQSIETKTHIAIFYTSEREDGMSAANQKISKLDSISLYSYEDLWRERNSSNTYKATPIKVVHFEYDYSLCGNVENNSGDPVDINGGTPSNTNLPDVNIKKGKLTLKKIYFTYGKGRKSQLSPYVFGYPTGSDENPDYHTNSYDRWGGYKPSSKNPDAVENMFFPYSLQNKTDADLYAGAWNLNSIILPSGGLINVKYESDDYAYVQDRKAMTMNKVLGFANELGGSYNSTLLQMQSGSPTFNNYIVVDIPAGTSLDDILRDENNDVMVNLFYSIPIDMKKSDDPDRKYETVKGYCKIDYENCDTVNGKAYIKLKPVEIDGFRAPFGIANPISKASWQYFSRNMRGINNDNSSPQDLAGFVNNIKSIIRNATDEVSGLLLGEYLSYAVSGIGVYSNLDRSYIRLYVKENKMGGGHRVKEIRLNDQWNEMTTNNDASSEYGQEYRYTLKNSTKTSGVAAYEPMVGNEENPLHEPVFYDENRGALISDYELMAELPFGESFYPGASVGYSRVEVMNLSHNNVEKHATGKVVNEFYTAKDFPVKPDMSDVEKEPRKTPGIFSFFKIRSKDYMYTSQGYTINTNDMHGKQKGQEVYGQNQTEPISKVEYRYKTKNGKLDNDVKVIKTNGQQINAQVGVDVDFVLDSRAFNSEVYSGGISFNTNGFMASVIPGIVFTLIPSFSSEKTVYKSIVSTKVVKSHGILEEVIAYDGGSKVSTKNLAYDAVTGDVLLTEVSNEYFQVDENNTELDGGVNNKKYSIQYPAHWAYPEMGLAYQNINFKLSGVTNTISSNYHQLTTSQTIDFRDYFVKGDEILISGKKLWVLEVNETNIKAVTKTGGTDSNIPTSVDIKIIESGYKNTPSAPIFSAVSLENPIVDNQLNISASSKIIDAQAVEYSDNWQMPSGWSSENTNAESGCELSIDAHQFEDFMNLLISNGVKFDNNYVNQRQLVELESKQLFLLNSNGNAIPYVGDHFYFKLLPFTSGPSNLFFELYANLNSQTPFRVHSSGSYNLGNNSASSYSWASNNIEMFFDLTTNNSYGYGNTIIAVDKSNVLLTNGNVIECGFNDTYPIPYLCDYNGSAISSLNTCGVIAGDKVNPYFYGIRGQWKPIKSYKYLTPREQSYSGTSSSGDIMDKNTDVRSDGVYTGFSNYWNYNNSYGHKKFEKSPSGWTWTAEVTQSDNNGNELENIDPLGRYSSAIYGYSNMLPIAVSSNAMYREIGYDGFEDYNSQLSCNIRHFNFDNYEFLITDNESHTGRYSMVVPSYGVSLARELRGVKQAANDVVAFTLDQTDLLDLFAPFKNYTVEQKFLISYWVMGDCNFDAIIDNSSVIESIITGFPTKSINGWKQYQYILNIPAGSTGDISFAFTSSMSNAYIDDIRIHPMDANMKSYVYDYKTSKLMAELDNNNFATFYEYDREGALVRVKKETERGIKMIQNVNQGSSKVSSK